MCVLNWSCWGVCEKSCGLDVFATRLGPGLYNKFAKFAYDSATAIIIIIIITTTTGNPMRATWARELCSLTP